MDSLEGPDPNRDSTDPMVESYWLLGEALQDRVKAAGYEPDEVEGIAVDLHDILQAADRIRDEILPQALAEGGLKSGLELLEKEIAHIRWHTVAAGSYLQRASGAIKGDSPN